jgi:hypothetical protein
MNINKTLVKPHLTLFILKNSCTLFLLSLFVCACVPTSDSSKVDKKYFDLTQFVQQQVNRLNAQKPNVKKQINLDGQTDEIQTDTLDWAKELALFSEADLNLPSLRDSYEIKEDKAKHTITYIAKEEKQKVREINIVFGENSEIEKVNIKEIKIVFSEDNQLYEIQRVMEMKLENNLLSAYSIKGFQKVILKDSLVYDIKATLVN